MMKAVFVLALSGALTLASPVPHVKRCDVPNPDMDVVYEIYSVAVGRNVPSKVRAIVALRAVSLLTRPRSCLPCLKLPGSRATTTTSSTRFLPISSTAGV